jgi:hypothetical protein
MSTRPTAAEGLAMSVLILSCPCGLRMKAKGATPGRVGRCPRCGQTLTVPGAAEAEAKVEPAARGYGLPSAFRPAVAKQVEKRPSGKKSNRRAVEPTKLPDVSREVEPSWQPDVLFPLRGAEGLMIVAMMGLAFWCVATLIPELCLAFVADASRMGATFMGMLVSLIVSLPALGLGFFAVTYALQYLGRVLVSGAMGEVVPPRPPDRNFDGLSSGLAPWLIWLACGASVGLGPLAAYLLSRGWNESSNAAVVPLLAVVGLPYALMSLIMTFLHDGGFPRPFGVVGALIRFNVKFLATCAVEFGLALLVLGAFAGVLMLRDHHYWVYMPLMLPCWMLALWVAIVGMRMLGVFYHHHASILRWHREKPWWAVTWDI